MPFSGRNVLVQLGELGVLIFCTINAHCCAECAGFLCLIDQPMDDLMRHMAWIHGAKCWRGDWCVCSFTAHYICLMGSMFDCLALMDRGAEQWKVTFSWPMVIFVQTHSDRDVSFNTFFLREIWRLPFLAASSKC